MTTATAEQPDTKNGQYPAEFEVEFGNDEKNLNFMLPFFERRVRGAYSMSNVRRNVGDMSGLPDHPGERLRIAPRKRAFHLYDPLKDDKDKVLQINRILRGKIISMPKYDPATHQFPESKQTDVDIDKIKSMIWMVMQLHEQGNCKVTKGKIPTQDEFDKMPGDTLYDPFSTNRYKPKYAKDGPEYERMAAMQPAAY